MEKINILRTKIDSLDMKILSLIASRRKTVQQIGKIKAISSRLITDKKRESEAIKIRLHKAKTLNIPLKLVHNIFIMLFSDSRQIQQNISHALTNEAKIDKIYR